jgi:hypothetical protein
MESNMSTLFKKRKLLGPLPSLHLKMDIKSHKKQTSMLQGLGINYLRTYCLWEKPITSEHYGSNMIERYQVPRTKGTIYSKECLTGPPASLVPAFIPPLSQLILIFLYAHACP